MVLFLNLISTIKVRKIKNMIKIKKNLVYYENT